MPTLKSFSRRIAVRVFFFMLVAFAAVAGGAYRLIDYASVSAQALRQQDPAVAINLLTQQVESAERLFWPYFLPAAFVFFLLLALFLWWSLARALKTPTKTPAAAAPAETKKSRTDEARPDPRVQQRMYLHLIAVLQREGRLMDFLGEDLAAYPDAQIGAAVRTIHENCRQTLKKHLAPEAILEQNEGAPITIEKDFDPNTIKLVGNVTGQPPFNGVVRHRGWRAAKIDPPVLSAQQDPGIIAPAEVEV